MDLLSVNKSYFELQRLRYRPETLKFLDMVTSLHIKHSTKQSTPNQEVTNLLPHLTKVPSVSLVAGEKYSSKPLKIGVLLSGGQAPGGHNVVIGLFEGLKAFNPHNRLLGFIKGPLGLISGTYKELDISTIYTYYNTGGFDMLSSSREKIKTEEQKRSILQTVNKLKLDGLLIIGGNNSNTDTAMLAEYFLQNNCNTAVIGVPKTIDGDLKNAWIETPLGFHSSCRVYSEMIGNLSKDSISIKKYYHFIRLMGRTASYTTLECALQTLPNISLISEYFSSKHATLKQVCSQIAQGIVTRSQKNKNYGTILIPEGLIVHLSDTRQLIKEINTLLLEKKDIHNIVQHLSPESKQTFLSLPEDIDNQLLLARDSYGNVRVSKIAMEELISKKVAQEVAALDPNVPFQPVTHFLGYEARAAFPSNFDANYAIALGILSVPFLIHKLTGYMITIKNLVKDYHDWRCQAVPLHLMMHAEQRLDSTIPVISTESVDLQSFSYKDIQSNEKERLTEDLYRFPGPLQFFGSKEIQDQRPLILIKDQQL